MLPIALNRKRTIELGRGTDEVVRLMLRLISYWKSAGWFRPSSAYRLVTWIQLCASLNHRETMKAESIWQISRKLTENLHKAYLT